MYNYNTSCSHSNSIKHGRIVYVHYKSGFGRWLCGSISWPIFVSASPLLGPSTIALVKLEALKCDKVVHEHQGWRLFSCIWLHAGIIHLLANLLSLVLIGIRLEQQFLFVCIRIIYLMAGVGGSVMSSLFIQNNISVGASGALFGLLGAMLSELLFTMGLAMLFKGEKGNKRCSWCNYVSCVPTSKWDCGN